MSPLIRVCIGGITGTVGRPVALGLTQRPDIAVVSGFARSTDTRRIHLGDSPVPVLADLRRALDPVEFHAEVYLDLTEPVAARRHAELALTMGVHVVIAATDADDNGELERLGRLASACERALVVAPNLALSVAWLEVLSRRAAMVFRRVEILDRASPGVPAPLRTSVELARSMIGVGVHPELRSERRTGLTSEVTVSMVGDGERLALSHLAVDARAYVAGAALVARAVRGRRGMFRGLSWALDE